jgi:type I restriction enzyme S subunit
MREDWIDIEIGEIATIYNGNSINAQVKEKKYKNLNDGYNYIGTKDVGFDAVVDYENGVKIPFEEESFKIAPKGCVLVCSEGGSAGRKTAYIEQDVCFGNKLYAIQTTNTIVI